MRRAYQAALNVRFAVEAASEHDADALATAVADNLAPWMDGSLGSPPWVPWITAWHEESVVPLALKPEQLANWNPIAESFEPFWIDDA